MGLRIGASGLGRADMVSGFQVLGPAAASFTQPPPLPCGGVEDASI